jgi:hypothetical protein
MDIFLILYCVLGPMVLNYAVINLKTCKTCKHAHSFRYKSCLFGNNAEEITHGTSLTFTTGALKNSAHAHALKSVCFSSTDYKKHFVNKKRYRKTNTDII